MLIDDIKRICRRLGPLGWTELFAAHGLDITARPLEKELSRTLDAIDRSLPGFEDFCTAGVRGIEPGVPSRSLFYHALASPRVVTRPRGRLKGFPTLAELETVENYVFAARKASLASIRKLARGPLEVVVFAYEYRAAQRTSHRRYADLTLSRTGVARIGTAPPRYDPRLRGFDPSVAGRPNAFRVTPAKYGAFLAVALKGKKSIGRPARFRTHGEDSRKGDERRMFFVPVHKLFTGSECLKDFPDLDVAFTCHHINEKIRRIHLQLAKRKTKDKKPFHSGWTEPDISFPPFQFTEGIAELGVDESDPPGLLTPIPHRAVVEPASYRGRPLGFNVPPDNGPISSSLALLADYNYEEEEIRHAPAYVHARTRIEKDGTLTDLNAERSVVTTVDEGGYVARHYVDYTGDGWVAVTARAANGKELGPTRPAFSLVAPPAFMYGCDQARAMDWTESLAPSTQKAIWYMAPWALSDMRLPANLQLTNTPFTADDATITAVVSMAVPEPTGKRFTGTVERRCHTPLADGAAGVFAPGWDVARDWLPDHRQHLASYGLGSPFPEDGKLCAALSAFWPAVAPDATREFAPISKQYYTVTPLTDEEIGRGTGRPWDDVPPPRLLKVNGETYAEYASFAHTDYVSSALQGRLTAAETGKLTELEYQRRTLAMATAYRALGAVGEKRNDWVVLSYRRIGERHPERRRAEKAAKSTLAGTVHRFELCRRSQPVPVARPPFKERLLVRDRTIVFVDDAGVVLIGLESAWKRKKVSWR